MREVPFPRFEVGLAIVAVIVLIFAAGGGEVRDVQAAPVVDVWQEREAAAAQIADSRPGTVSFAVVDAAGNDVASHQARNPVSAASTIKAMILAAYLRGSDVADRELTSAESTSLQNMITWSSNQDATSLLEKAGWPARDEVAAAAGMQGGYTPNHESWGLTQITAASMAMLFHELPTLIPAEHREFALGLFGKVVPGQQWGMTRATPAGWSWHVKGGWISQVVNQIGTFTKDGQEFTVAVTVEGEPGTGAAVSASPDSVPAVQTIELITDALFGDGSIPAPPGSGDDGSMQSDSVQAAATTLQGCASAAVASDLPPTWSAADCTPPAAAS